MSSVLPPSGSSSSSSSSSPLSIPLLPSFRRQQLLLDFARLKRRCPEGIYLASNPHDASLWSGVFFVREGAYASAVLRFDIAFPNTYPDSPPLVVFLTEIFHPLLVPLTTYTVVGAGGGDGGGTSYSAGSAAPYPTATKASDPAAADSSMRPPPGAFSLKHGFPEWTSISHAPRKSGFNISSDKGEGKGREVDDTTTTTTTTTTPAPATDKHESGLKLDSQAGPSILVQPSVTAPEEGGEKEEKKKTKGENERPAIIAVLEYIKSAFEDANLLDALPLEAAGNPGAWHAWRAHRGLPRNTTTVNPPSEKNTITTTTARASSLSTTPSSSQLGGSVLGRASSGPLKEMGNPRRSVASPARSPGDWNWDGVWEARMRNGVEESVSDALLFGSKGTGTRGGGGLTGYSSGFSTVPSSSGTMTPSNNASSTADMIRFSKFDDDKLEGIEKDMMRLHGFAVDG